MKERKKKREEIVLNQCLSLFYLPCLYKRKKKENKENKKKKEKRKGKRRRKTKKKKTKEKRGKKRETKVVNHFLSFVYAICYFV